MKAFLTKITNELYEIDWEIPKVGNLTDFGTFMSGTLTIWYNRKKKIYEISSKINDMTLDKEEQVVDINFMIQIIKSL